jgi:sugar phosphate permease
MWLPEEHRVIGGKAIGFISASVPQPKVRMTSQITGARAGNSSNQSVMVAGRSVEASLNQRWLYLLPAVFITYSLAYLDRANYGFGAAAGLAATLHITEKDTAILGGLFFLGYFAFQIPGAAVARKYSVRRVVFATLVAWGVFAALTGVIRQFWLLALDRFLLGVAESLIFPVMLHLLTRWFTRAERSRANAILLLGNPVTVLWMSAITGYLIQRFGWQMTFIIEGLPSVLWAVVWILFVRDRPSEAKWITREAAELLETRLTQEQSGIAPVEAVRKALLRGDVLPSFWAQLPRRKWSPRLWGYRCLMLRSRLLDKPFGWTRRRVRLALFYE